MNSVIFRTAARAIHPLLLVLSVVLVERLLRLP